jgi:phage/plasmid-associated DNA primase
MQEFHELISKNATNLSSKDTKKTRLCHFSIDGISRKVVNLTFKFPTIDHLSTPTPTNQQLLLKMIDLLMNEKVDLCVSNIVDDFVFGKIDIIGQINDEFLLLFFLEFKEIVNKYISHSTSPPPTQENLFCITEKKKAGKTVSTIYFPFIYTHRIIWKDYIIPELVDNIETKGISQINDTTEIEIVNADDFKENNHYLFGSKFIGEPKSLNFKFLYLDVKNTGGTSTGNKRPLIDDDDDDDKHDLNGFFLKNLDVDDLRRFCRNSAEAKCILKYFQNSKFLLPWILSQHKDVNSGYYYTIKEVYNNANYRLKLSTYINQTPNSNSLNMTLNINNQILQSSFNKLIRMLNYKRIAQEDFFPVMNSILFKAFEISEDELVAQQNNTTVDEDIDFDDLVGLELFCEWCKVALSRNSQVNSTHIERMLKKIKNENSPLQFYLLEEFAQEDNPQMYMSWKVEQDESVVEIVNRREATHLAIALILFKLYKNEFRCVNVENSKCDWYYFSKQRHKWVLDEKGDKLKKKIDFILIPYFRELRFLHYVRTANQQLDEISDLQVMYMLKDPTTAATLTIPPLNNLNSKKTPFTEIILNLQHNYFVDGVMKTAMRQFSKDDRFMEKLNTFHKYLVGFENGVYDLESDTFRAGRPDDYISFSMGVPYRDFSTDPDNPLLKEVEENFYGKLYVDEALRNYVLRYDASCLEAGNPDKVAFINYGRGDNGKTLKEEFMKYVFGEYYGCLPIQYYFEKHTETDKPSPVIVNLMGTRRVYSEESREGVVINSGRYKQITGNSILNARNLRSNIDFKFRPTFKVGLGMNRVFTFGNDQAIRNRNRVIPYLSTFNDKAPDDEEEQKRKKHFKVDKKYSEKFPILGEALVYLLIQKYKDYKRDGLGPIPDLVREATDKVHKANDYYQSFVSETLTECNEPVTTPLTLDNLYDSFRNNMPQSYPQLKHRLPDKHTFYDEIVTYIGLPDTDNPKQWFRWVDKKSNK